MGVAKILIIIIGVVMIIMSLVEIINKEIEYLPILAIFMIPLVYCYITYSNYTTTTTLLSGVVKEKYLSHSKTRSYYKTAVEIEDENGKYIITLDDSDLFSENIVGSKIHLEKKYTFNRKNMKAINTTYKYIYNSENI